jgi:parallel beta-helix repeat protein
MKDRYKGWAGQCRALTMGGAPRGILARVCCLGVLVMCGIMLASVSARANDVIVVPRDFPTIQAAVDAAAPGATIQVRAGTYIEEVVIAKTLTLTGAGISKTIIKSPSTLTLFADHLVTKLPVVAIVRITDSADVKMSGFTVTGPTPCGIEGGGIRVVKAATLELSDTHVTRMQTEDGTCTPDRDHTRGIVIGLPPVILLDGAFGTIGHGIITEVVIDGYRQAGITVAGPPGGTPSTASLSHNLITGGALIPIDGQTGIHLAGAALAQVRQNKVRGNVCTHPVCGPDPLNQVQSLGILAALVGEDGSEISENQVSDNDIGIYQFASPHCCTIRENRVRNNRFFGIVIQDGDGTTSENTISGGQVGIAVVASFEDTVGVLRGDTITGASEEPIREIECCGFTATAIVEDD